MATPHVCKLQRSDQQEAYVLVRITARAAATGPLNVKLMATEGVAPYALEIRQDRVDRLRAKNAPCSAEEWEQILTRILLDQEPVPGVDATATVDEEKQLTISVRRRVQNITQRLGSFTLAYAEDEDVELFEWCAEAVDGWTSVQLRLGQTARERDKLERAVDDLRQQLEQFLAAKEEDEKAMLEKFCVLLNEKKVKIRVQQQLLAASQSTTTEPKEEDVEIKEEDADQAPMPKLPPAKRGSKRRAAAVSPADASESDSDDDFEGPAMRTRAGTVRKAAASVPPTQETKDSSEEDRTTDHNESTESDEMEGMDEEKEAPAKEKSPKKTAATKPKPPKVEAPPPRRNLAFGVAPKDNDSETESDDEL